MSDDTGEPKKTYFMAPLRIDTSSWTKQEHKASLRQRLVKYIAASKFIFYQDFINNLVSWVTVFTYIYYVDHLIEVRQSSWFMWFQYSVHVYFLLDFSFRLLCSQYPRVIITQFINIIEMTTTVPFFVMLLLGQGDIDNVFFRFCIMLDTSRVYLTKRVIYSMTTDNTRDMLNIGNIMLLIVIFPAAFCSFVESRETYPNFDERPDATFFQMVYFVFISMTFIGYGSQVVTTLGKVFLTVYLLVCLFVLPTQAGKLMKLFTAKSPWARAKFEKIGKNVPHLILMGAISESNLKNFLDEFFHEDHEGSKKQCVVIQNMRPSNAILDIINDPTYVQQVIYLEGDHRDTGTLKRADIYSADAVMILNDKLSADASHSDTEIILQAMFIKNTLLQQNQNVNICMQLMKPESNLNYHLSLDQEVVKKDQIVCIEQIKFSLMAKSCLCPGLVTLISNIIQSSGDPPEELEEKDQSNIGWLSEYWQGKTFEIYREEIPQSFASKQFCTIANDIYKEDGLLLFALEIVVNNKQGDIMLNPGDYRLPRPPSYSNDRFTYYGYFIAGSKEDTENITIFQENQNVPEELDQEQVRQDEMREMQQKIYTAESEVENKIEVDNIDGDLFRVCQVSPQPVLKDDIIFETLQESKLAENHIIICGLVENLRYFVMPLRAKHLQTIQPIVILNEDPISINQWQQLSYFTQIYFVRGSTLSEEAYDRVNIMQAKQVVILTSPTQGSLEMGDEAELRNREDQAAYNDDECMRDAKTIFMYNIIKKKNPKVNVVTELIKEDNIAYMLEDPRLYFLMGEYGYDKTPIFTSGEIYLSSLMDSLLCQAYYNSELTTVLKQLIIGDAQKSKSRSRQTSWEPDFSSVSTSNLYHVQVPYQFTNRKYSSLFDYLTTRRFMIPIGLYRRQMVNYDQFNEDDEKYKVGVGNNSKIGAATPEQLKEIKYVITNPQKSIKLRADDLVFVLAQSDPSSPETWDDYNYFNNQKQEEAKKDVIAKGNDLQQNEAKPQHLTTEQEKENDAVKHLDPFIEQKRMRKEFEDSYKKLKKMIVKARADVVQIHKDMNTRDSTIVQDITSYIDEIAHSVQTIDHNH